MRLWFNLRTTLRFELAIEQRGKSAISITRSLGDNRADHRQQPFVVRLRASRQWNRWLKQLDQVRARHSQRLRYRFHLESPGPGQFERNSSFLTG